MLRPPGSGPVVVVEAGLEDSTSEEGRASRLMLNVAVESGSCGPVVDEVPKEIPEEANDGGMSDGGNASVCAPLRTGPSVLTDTGARYVERYVMHQDSGIGSASLIAPAESRTFPRTARTKHRLIALI